MSGRRCQCPRQLCTQVAATGSQPAARGTRALGCPDEALAFHSFMIQALSQAPLVSAVNMLRALAAPAAPLPLPLTLPPLVTGAPARHLAAPSSACRPMHWQRSPASSHLPKTGCTWRPPAALCWPPLAVCTAAPGGVAAAWWSTGAGPGPTSQARAGQEAEEARAAAVSRWLAACQPSPQCLDIDGCDSEVQMVAPSLPVPPRERTTPVPEDLVSVAGAGAAPGFKCQLC